MNSIRYLTTIFLTYYALISSSLRVFENHKPRYCAKLGSFKPLKLELFSSTSDDSNDDVQKREIEKKRMIEQKRSEYEAKLLEDVKQITKNQEKFFAVAKFLIPLVIFSWAYSFFSGSGGF